MNALWIILAVLPFVVVPLLVARRLHRRAKDLPHAPVPLGWYLLGRQLYIESTGDHLEDQFHVARIKATLARIAREQGIPL